MFQCRVAVLSLVLLLITLEGEYKPCQLPTLPCKDYMGYKIQRVCLWVKPAMEAG